MNAHAATLPRGAGLVRSPAILNQVVAITPARARQLSPYVAATTFLWALTCLSTNIKIEVVPYIDWILFAPALLGVILQFRPDRICARALFLLAILVGGVLADNVPLAMIWIGKLSLIFIGLACFPRIPAINRVLWCALVVSLYGNVVCLTLGELGWTFFADVVTSEGRVGTALNLPGSLWHIGMSLVFYYSYLLVSTPKHRNWNLVSLIACLYIIFSDGGRTAILIVLMIPCLFVYVFFREGRIGRLIPFAIGGVLVVAVVFAAFELEESVAMTRVMPIFTGEAHNRDGLKAFDTTRYDMLQRALDLIHEHPILGNGCQSAAITTELEGSERMVVHNAYLQLWADYGLLGLVTFLVIVLGWIAEAPARLRRIVAVRDLPLRARYYNALFILLWFGTSLLFHPFSSEWSEWILFLMPTCLLANLHPAIGNRAAAQVAVA